MVLAERIPNGLVIDVGERLKRLHDRRADGRPLGVNAGLSEQLDRIEQQAIELRDKAATGMKLCRDELAKELINLGPD